MKSCKNIIVAVNILLLVSVINNCTKVTGKLDDQTPVLIVNIEIVNDPTNIIQINDAKKVCLIYYANSDWTNPWLTQASNSNTIINPVVGTYSTFIAVFWDMNGNGVPDTNEPCTGYENSSHSGIITPGTPDPLTRLSFYPLQWRAITIKLDPAILY